MNKLFYPALFHKAEEGGYWITFPDLPECMTQGDDMQHAYEMAFEALGLAITSRSIEQIPLPTPSEPFSISTEKDEFCVIIEFDMLAYKKRTNSKSVKKHLQFQHGSMKKLLLLKLTFLKYFNLHLWILSVTLLHPIKDNFPK